MAPHWHQTVTARTPPPLEVSKNIFAWTLDAGAQGLNPGCGPLHLRPRVMDPGCQTCDRGPMLDSRSWEECVAAWARMSVPRVGAHRSYEPRNLGPECLAQDSEPPEKHMISSFSRKKNTVAELQHRATVNYQSLTGYPTVDFVKMRNKSWYGTSRTNLFQTGEVRRSRFLAP